MRGVPIRADYAKSETMNPDVSAENVLRPLLGEDPR